MNDRDPSSSSPMLKNAIVGFLMLHSCHLYFSQANATVPITRVVVRGRVRSNAGRVLAMGVFLKPAGLTLTPQLPQPQLEQSPEQEQVAHEQGDMLILRRFTEEEDRSE